MKVFPVTEKELHNALEKFINFPNLEIKAMEAIVSYILDKEMGDRDEAQIPANILESKIMVMLKNYALEQLSNEDYLDIKFGERMPIYTLTEKGKSRKEEVLNLVKATKQLPAFKDRILLTRNK